jgi:ATP-dependent Clp endopeptidase proteolytic subunit ClpP
MKKEPIQFESNHFLTGDINNENIESAMKWVVDANEKKVPSIISLYINSDGGDLAGAFALIDVMRVSAVPVSTIGIGNIMSSAFMIFASGTKGHRAISKNTSIMMHQFHHDFGGKYHDIKAFSQEFDRINQRMLNTLIDCSGMSEDDVRKYLLGPTDSWIDAYQLKEYGIADYIF